ncbi:MAG: L,D-transpeptidase family protein [Bdellovibrio sp.]
MLKFAFLFFIFAVQASAVQFKNGTEFLSPEEKAVIEKKLEEEKPPSLCERTEGFFQKSPIVNQQAKVDKILVDKKRRLLHLLNGEEVIATYRMALGFNPTGHKEMEGDGRTPEGLYFIELKNLKSAYYLSLRVNYPNAKDLAAALLKGIKDPGKDIMIHGLPNNWFVRKIIKHPADWTKGCMAVTNEEIKQIYSMVNLGTLIEICP